jgi:hypothetical protein
LRAHLSLRHVQKLFEHHPQIEERKQSVQPSRVLHQASVAHLHMSELALEHTMACMVVPLLSMRPLALSVVLTVANICWLSSLLKTQGGSGFQWINTASAPRLCFPLG